MVIYNKDAGGGGLCKEFTNKNKKKLSLLWSKSKSGDKESFIAFAKLGQDIHTSNIKEGQNRSVDRLKQMEALSELPKEVREGSSLKGIIHTHPDGEGLMNTILSPGDMNNHIIMMDKIRAYRASLILTKDKGSMILFGVVSPENVSGLDRRQDRMSALLDRMEIDKKQGFGIYDMLNEMAHEMDKIGKPCSYEFKE